MCVSGFPTLPIHGFLSRAEWGGGEMSRLMTKPTKKVSVRPSKTRISLGMGVLVSDCRLGVSPVNYPDPDQNLRYALNG